MENFGSGIRRIYSLYSDFNKNPEIAATENSFKITLYNRNYLLNQEHVKFSKDKTIRLLNHLISEDIVIKRGESISTFYSLKNR